MPRRREPRIENIANHPRRYVSVRVAAEYLERDERTVRGLMELGVLGYSLTGGGRRRIEVAELAAYEERCRVHARVERDGVPVFHVPRHTPAIGSIEPQ